MDIKKTIVYSRVFNNGHTHFKIFKEISHSFGYEDVTADSEEKSLLYLKDADSRVFFCDDRLFKSGLQIKINELGVNREKIHVVLLNTDISNEITYSSAIDNILILSLPDTLFEQSLFSVFKYVEMREKLINVSGVMDPEFIKKLLSDTSHAINNILTGMQGYAELAQLNPDDKKLIQDSFRVVLDSSYRVLNEVKNLRAFARVENPLMEPVNISDILRESVDLTRNRIRAKNLKLDVDVVQGLLINGDYDQLVQVFFNLLNDVINNIDEKGSITIGLSKCNVSVLVIIVGRGYKLDEKDIISLERIFAFNEPVLKSDSKEGKIENRNVLSICNRIVHNHRGNILIEERDKPNIAYTVKLPVLKAHAERAVTEDVLEKRVSMDIQNLDMEILIVDDEEYVRNTMYYFFNQKGCRVTVAEDGEFGFNIAKEKPFDLIFMDYLMPKMGGIEAARKIMENNKDVKIVFITGRESLNEEELYKSGIYACIKKPFEMKDLYDIAKKVAFQKGVVG